MAEVEHYDITSGYKTAQRKYKYKDVEINNMLDLTNPDVRNQLGISLDELTVTGQGSYKLTNEIGTLANESGFDGIIAPSARNPSGANVIVFGGF